MSMGGDMLPSIEVLRSRYPALDARYEVRRHHSRWAERLARLGVWSHSEAYWLGTLTQYGRAQWSYLCESNGKRSRHRVILTARGHIAFPDHKDVMDVLAALGSAPNGWRCWYSVRDRPSQPQYDGGRKPPEWLAMWTRYVTQVRLGRSLLRVLVRMGREAWSPEFWEWAEGGTGGTEAGEGRPSPPQPTPNGIWKALRPHLEQLGVPTLAGGAHHMVITQDVVPRPPHSSATRLVRSVEGSHRRSYVCNVCGKVVDTESSHHRPTRHSAEAIVYHLSAEHRVSAMMR